MKTADKLHHSDSNSEKLSREKLSREERQLSAEKEAGYDEYLAGKVKAGMKDFAEGLSHSQEEVEAEIRKKLGLD
jgi:predicted transcriptional regulator